MNSPRHNTGDEMPTALNNNCSGNHAAFICVARGLMRWNDEVLNLRQYMKA